MSPGGPLRAAGMGHLLRGDDGSYWTGWVHPQGVHFPGGERTTYSAAAVVPAHHALAAAGLFRGTSPLRPAPSSWSRGRAPEEAAGRERL